MDDKTTHFLTDVKFLNDLTESEESLSKYLLDNDLQDLRTSIHQFTGLFLTDDGKMNDFGKRLFVTN